MASGQDIRITDVPFNSVPDPTSTVFINDNGKLRQTDLTTIAKYSQLYESIIGAHNTAMSDINQQLEDSKTDITGLYDQCMSTLTSTKENLEQALILLANEKSSALEQSHSNNLAELTTLFENSVSDINTLIESGHNKLLNDINAVDDLRTYSAILRDVTFNSNANAEIESTLQSHLFIKSIKGDSYQAGVPTRDNPQNIESVGDSGTIRIDIYDADYIDCKSVDIPLREPLRGIGDVKDEIFCKSGVYGVLRRIGYIAEYVSETITTEYISTTGGLDNHATVIYVLPTPVIEPFEDQSPFFKLSTLENKTCIAIGCNNDNLNITATVQYPSTESGVLLAESYVCLYNYFQMLQMLTEICEQNNTELEKCFQSVSDGKALVASAITDKRVSTDATATFAEMAANIGSIVLGSGNATVDNVLVGKTFTNDDGIEYEGTMANNGAVQVTWNRNNLWDCMNNGNEQKYVIPAGYHNGSGYVSLPVAEAQFIRDTYYNAGVAAGGGIKEIEGKTAYASASDWSTATASCTKYCSAGTWIVGVTAKGDSPTNMKTSCSPVTEAYTVVEGKYAGAGFYRVELSSPANITASGLAGSNSDFGSYTTATAVFIKIK